MRYLTAALYGFGEYTTHEKIIIFFLALLVAYFISAYFKTDRQTYKNGRRSQRLILCIYAFVATILLLLPLTAMLLLRYQTLVYTYGYLWALIPIVPMISFGATEILFDNYNQASENLRLTARSAVLLLLIAGILFLSSDKFQNSWKEKQLIAGETLADKKRMDLVCEKILSLQENPVLLSTPEEMEYARLYPRNIRTVYGRNLWDESMNVFTDDRYDGLDLEFISWLHNYMSYGAFYSFYSNNAPIFCAPYRDVDMHILEENEPNLYRGYSIMKKAVDSGANIIALPVIYCNDMHTLLNSEDIIYSVGASDAMGYNYLHDTAEDSILTDQIGLHYMAQFLGAVLYEEDVDSDGKLDHYFLVIPEGTTPPGYPLDPAFFPI